MATVAITSCALANMPEISFQVQELFGDHVQGVSTDFPAIIALGQTWNKELVKRVGKVIGTENLNTCDFSGYHQ
ncbi:MAG: hypothetical protein ACLU6Y_09900 [Ruminococcus sp.]